MTSRRHQRRAALPGAGYTRPSSLDPTGLIVTVFGESGGVEGIFDFTNMPGSVELRRAFAAALDRRSGPAGTWRSGETCRNGYWALRAFLEYVVARVDAPATAAEISPAMWAAWRLSLPHNHTARNRLALLRTVLPLVHGLPAETVDRDRPEDRAEPAPDRGRLLLPPIRTDPIRSGGHLQHRAGPDPQQPRASAPLVCR